MKIFWTIVLVLLIAAGATAMLADGSRSEPRVDRSAEPTDRTVARATPEAEPSADPARAPARADGAAAESEAPPEAPPEVAPETGEASEAKPDPSEPVESEPVEPEPSEQSEPSEAESSDQPAESKPTESASSSSEPSSEPTDESESDEPRDVADEDTPRFVIEGEGTKEKPYEVSWDLLMSASDTYQPRLGRDEIPEHIKKLDGKQVRIRGHATFPMMADEPTEMLLMLNEWDGCCLGVPPTPYDAVEIALSEPVRGRDRYLSRATVEGTFRVDPYLVGEWLVGLYVMEDVRISNTQHGMGQQID